MALINCPECGREISDHALSCPHCGYSVGIAYKEVGLNIHRGSPGKVVLILGIICWIGWAGYNLVTVGDRVGENAFYLSHGYHRSEYFINEIITKALLFGAVIQTVIGFVILFVYRKNDRRN